MGWTWGRTWDWHGVENEIERGDKSTDGSGDGVRNGALDAAGERADDAAGNKGWAGYKAEDGTQT